jgi:hypothetical protein
VEDCRVDCDPSVGDADDRLIERLTAIAWVMQPVPAAVLDEASRLFVTGPLGSGDPTYQGPN